MATFTFILLLVSIININVVKSDLIVFDVASNRTRNVTESKLADDFGFDPITEQSTITLFILLAIFIVTGFAFLVLLTKLVRPVMNSDTDFHQIEQMFKAKVEKSNARESKLKKSKVGYNQLNDV